MTDFYNKDTYTFDDIQMLINERIPESLKLDYKASGAVNANMLKDIGKDVSSFANSAGGIIVYGIKEVNQVPAELTFIDGKQYTRERLEHFIARAVEPRIENLMIYPIVVDNDLSKTIYVVKVPQSNRIHMNMDNRYYRRYNFESVPMEEYEVRNMYLRANLSELDLSYRTIYQNNHTKNKHSITFEFNVLNSGASIERFYKLILEIPRTLFAKAVDKDLLQNRYYSTFTRESIILSIPNTSPVFQNEQDLIASIDFDVTVFDEKRFVGQIDVKLLYSNGARSESIILKDKWNALWEKQTDH
ncbi:ATP-binding protein [Olivibacter sp. CPCC 100613]|uniref:AlbA family DNA-binding domain-containing protein n=1 Tax=Olivibacter sp. CPCC 100613 TaxID=3079931 RepID=UPI002FFC31E4